MDPTDQELESVLAKLRESVDGMSADELTDAIEKLEHDEAAGQISRRHLLEASVICAVICFTEAGNDTRLACRLAS